MNLYFQVVNLKYKWYSIALSENYMDGSTTETAILRCQEEQYSCNSLWSFHTFCCESDDALMMLP